MLGFNYRMLAMKTNTPIPTSKPGDLFFTGTPEEVILGMPPEKRVWLKAGDKIVTVLEILDELHFTLV